MYLFVYFLLVTKCKRRLGKELSLFACHVSRGLKGQKMYSLFLLYSFEWGLYRENGWAARILWKSVWIIDWWIIGVGVGNLNTN